MGLEFWANGLGKSLFVRLRVSFDAERGGIVAIILRLIGKLVLIFI